MRRKQTIGGRRRKIHTWAKRSRQKGGFIFAALAGLGSLIAAGIAAAAPAVATGVVGAAAGYATTKILESVGGKTGKGRHARRVRIRRRI